MAESAAIRSALHELEELGHSLEIVDGVEDDARRLAPVIERLHGDGLYVLCRSNLLGRDTVEQLREILLAHHVPFGRTVTVATRRPRDLVERIKASVARSGTRRPGAPAEASEASRPAIAETPPTAATSPTLPALGVPAPVVTRTRLTQVPPGARASASADAFEDAITGAQAVLRADDLAGGRTADDDDDFDPPTIELPPQRPTTETTDPEIASISLSDAIIDLDDSEPDPQHDVDNSLAGANLSGIDFSDLERVDSGRIDLARVPRVPVRTGGTSVSPAPLPPPAPPPMPGPPMPPAPPRASASAPQRPPIATLAVPPVRQDARPPIPAVFQSASSMSAPAGVTAPYTRVGDDDDAAPSSRRILWAGGLLATAAIALGVAWAMSGDDPADEVASADTEAPASPEAAAEAADGPSAASDTPPPAGDDAVQDTAVIEHAAPLAPLLAERKVRALDILLVQPASAGPMSHSAAMTYCDALDLAGRRGWRLPEVGELSSLTEAGMVGPSLYWSRTAGDTFGDTHLAWQGRRRRVMRASGDCRVLCVHGERVP